MAERRMFAKTIIDSDAFLDMPLSTQSLYFHLSMRADDDGFINNPKRIQRLIGASDDDLRLLIAKSFIITFESGVVVIKHWKIHNYIQRDRYKPTVYHEEKEMLDTKENKAYTLCIQDVSKMDTQVRLGKVRLGEDSVLYGEYKHVELSNDKYKYLENMLGTKTLQTYIDKIDSYLEQTGKHYNNCFEAIKYWYKQDQTKPKQTQFSTFAQRDNEVQELEELEKLMLEEVNGQN